MVIGALLLAPALFLQIIFGAGGAIVMLPGIVLFGGSVALLAYGWPQPLKRGPEAEAVFRSVSFKERRPRQPAITAVCRSS